MIEVRLIPHPERAPSTPFELTVTLSREGEQAVVDYRLAGPIARVHVPPLATPARRDELWRHTCFELFASGPGTGYQEFNFAPSREWAAYTFTDYRDGMTSLPIESPRIDISATADQLSLTARLRIAPSIARIGLSAVIEEQDGRVSYWALAHPPGAPDFHHPDCFALQLPPAG